MTQFELVMATRESYDMKPVHLFVGGHDIGKTTLLRGIRHELEARSPESKKRCILVSFRGWQGDQQVAEIETAFQRVREQKADVVLIDDVDQASSTIVECQPLRGLLGWALSQFSPCVIMTSFRCRREIMEMPIGGISVDVDSAFSGLIMESRETVLNPWRSTPAHGTWRKRLVRCVADALRDEELLTSSIEETPEPDGEAMPLEHAIAEATDGYPAALGEILQGISGLMERWEPKEPARLLSLIYDAFAPSIRVRIRRVLLRLEAEHPGITGIARDIASRARPLDAIDRRHVEPLLHCGLLHEEGGTVAVTGGFVLLALQTVSDDSTHAAVARATEAPAGTTRASFSRGTDCLLTIRGGAPTLPIELTGRSAAIAQALVAADARGISHLEFGKKSKSAFDTALSDLRKRLGESTHVLVHLAGGRYRLVGATLTPARGPKRARSSRS